MNIQCRGCRGDHLVKIIDLGNQMLSDFRSDKSAPEKYPLEVLLCQKCSLVQLSTTAPRELMYHDGYGYKSGVNENLKTNLHNLVKKALTFHPNPNSWLDIASNDGTLLSFVPLSTYRLGVDPVSKFAEEAGQYADKIISDYFPPSREKLEKEFEVITSSFMFYDVDDPNYFVQQVKKVLAKNGVWLVQQNYLLAMIKNNTYDNISHEHITYYCLTSMISLLSAHDLEVTDVYEDPINGGSFITVIRHRNVSKVQPSIQEMLKKEEDFGVCEAQNFSHFALEIEKLASELRNLIIKLCEQGKVIDIYGASTRGATIWQKAGIDNKLIRYAVERQEGKIGKYFSAIQVPIVSEKQMRESPPDYLLIGPWFLKDMFIEREEDFLKQGGKMIFPLPNVEVISKVIE